MADIAGYTDETLPRDDLGIQKFRGLVRQTHTHFTCSVITTAYVAEHF